MFLQLTATEKNMLRQIQANDKEIDNISARALINIENVSANDIKNFYSLCAENKTLLTLLNP